MFKLRVITQFIRRFIVSIIVMSIINVFILGFFVFSQANQTNVMDTVNNLVKQLDISSNSAKLSNFGKKLANSKEVWIMILDSDSGEEIYEYKKPSEVPTQYNLADVAKFTRYYLNDYPVFVQIVNNKILVFGFSKDRVFRFPFDYYEKSDFHSLFILAFFLLGINCLYLLIIYTYSTRLVQRKITPLVLAIKKLPEGLSSSVSTQDELKQLTEAINIADKKLKEGELFKENWISGIAHDIKTPLSVITSNASLIRSDTVDKNQLRRLRSILNESYYIQNTVNDLNIFARLTNSPFTLKLESVKIIPFFKEIIIQIINQEVWENINFSFEFDDELQNSKISIEKNLISRVVHNIIYNSILHNPEGCNVNISLHRDKEFLIITIEDDGIGIANDKLLSIYDNNKIIEEFDISGIRRHGMGLKISKQIIEVHEGTFKVESKENQFFKVIINLPLEHDNY
ncbi:sensor histidine kinase [Streptococcus suis]|uniref:sensor histidine kinase n=1 Tax=Streptococcus suis TaxID=1307 RepID=UPI000CF58B59|nr:HAMP domain-containing sensor histidine kinase [Streptococcus suis]